MSDIRKSHMSMALTTTNKDFKNKLARITGIEEEEEKSYDGVKLRTPKANGNQADKCSSDQ